MKAVLTIAGSDSSGGAGIQADIKTIEAHGLFAESAITALTAQNTTGVFGVVPVDPAFVEQQIDVVFDDIRPAAVKIGMVSDAAIVMAIAKALRRQQAKHIVIDPVMVATSGSELMVDGTIRTLREELFPLATVITPNLSEAQVLSGMVIDNEEKMERAADIIANMVVDDTMPRKPAVLIKGGHAVSDSGSSDDVLRMPGGEIYWMRGPRIDNPNTHGTGCTLSSAIACGLARGDSLVQAVRSAKDYITGALEAGLNLGRGSGPLDHMWEYR